MMIKKISSRLLSPKIEPNPPNPPLHKQIIKIIINSELLFLPQPPPKNEPNKSFLVSAIFPPLYLLCILISISSYVESDKV